MSADEIAGECGFDSAWDLITSKLSNEELLDMLHEYLLNDGHALYDLVKEIAQEECEWVDRDAVREAHEDAQYQAWRDERRLL